MFCVLPKLINILRVFMPTKLDVLYSGSKKLELTIIPNRLIFINFAKA
jgi:hypothetical protein